MLGMNGVTTLLPLYAFRAWAGQTLHIYVYATYFCVFDTLLWEVYLKWAGCYSRQAYSSYQIHEISKREYLKSTTSLKGNG
jgi:hypothetical protein